MFIVIKEQKQQLCQQELELIDTKNKVMTLQYNANRVIKDKDQTEAQLKLALELATREKKEKTKDKYSQTLKEK